MGHVCPSIKDMGHIEVNGTVVEKGVPLKDIFLFCPTVTCVRSSTVWHWWLHSPALVSTLLCEI